MNRLLATPLLLAGLLAVAALPAAEEKPEPKAPPIKADDVQDVVYFSESRPVLLRLRLQVDGKSFRASWNEFLDKLFTYLDTDGDGVLDAKEAARVPSPGALFAGFQPFGGGPVQTPALKELDLDGDGKVSKAELGAYYRKNGFPAFQVRSGSSGGGGRGGLAFTPGGRLVGGGGYSAEQLDNAFFSILDTNKDGKLSADELARAPELLLKHDFDDDEMITPDELLRDLTPTEGGGVAVFYTVNPLGGGQSDGSFHVLEPGESGKALAGELLRRYGKAAKPELVKSVTREQLGLDAATFAKLDTNGDGVLDAAELANFAGREPDLELKVNLSAPVAAPPPAARPGQPALPVLWGRGPLAEGVAVEVVLPQGDTSPLAKALGKTPEGQPLLALGRTRIAWTNGAADMTGSVRFLRQQARLVEFYVTQFKAADTAGKGYLDEREAARTVFGPLFKLMDRDGDGKLYEKEVRAYFEAMEGIMTAASDAGVTLQVGERGRGLFDLVDTDQDGRLSVREMRQVAKKFLALDRDGDGCLSRNEVPRDLEVSFSRGGGAANPFTGVVFAAPVGSRTGPRQPAQRPGPVWFVKMDRNGDGDVSRREWLGTEEEFRKIDTDGDGLISLEEAEAYDKLMRPQPKAEPRRER